MKNLQLSQCEYLVQEWIYRGVPIPVEKNDKYFEKIEDAEMFYNKKVEHLKQIKQNENIFPSFVRFFKMKESVISHDGIGVDYCINRFDV